MKITVSELAELLGGTIHGDSGKAITGIASIADAGEGDLTFFGNLKYLPALKQCKATAALVPENFSEEILAVQIRVANPSLAFSQVVEKLAPPPIQFSRGIHPTATIGSDVAISETASIQPYAVIESGVKIGNGTVIGAHCYIGHRSTIGENCLFYPHVTLREDSKLGDRVILHSGVVVGSDGFGFEMENGRHVKIPQTGNVQIDNDVEIGANTTIDRARFGRTWIQEGTKTDNQIQIAHNVVVGKHSIIVSQTAIGGSAQLGNYVTLGGKTGVAGHIKIGDQAVVGAKSGVIKDVPPKAIMLGYPAIPIREQKRIESYTKRLEKLFARVKQLEKQLNDSESGERRAETGEK